MKLFIVHFNICCCANNSDGKMWVVAESKEKAEEIALKEVSRQQNFFKLTYTESFEAKNEIIYSSFNRNDLKSRFKKFFDNWLCN